MYKPNFDLGVFKKTLVKESLKRQFSLDNLDKNVELHKNSEFKCQFINVSGPEFY